MRDLIESNCGGIIRVKEEKNPIELYLHQTEALHVMDKVILDREVEGFAGLLVMPTGGGKTLITVQWVLRNIINNNKKVLWLARRHELLDQTLAEVKRNSYSDLINKRKEFRYRIISGKHDKPVNIRKDDDFIIASKDSLNMGLNFLTNNWLNHNNDIFLVVDEAHYTTTKTYRKIIYTISEKADRLDILGLTTPFRTAETERGLLKEIFKDDILYKIDLRTLVSRGILSEPIFKEVDTEMDMTEVLSEQDIKNIQALDSIPEDIARNMAENKVRNNKIVFEYMDNEEQYGKLIVFAVSKIHAIELNKLFNERGIASEYVISSEQHIETGLDLSSEANRKKIRKFRDNEIDVIINVNIPMDVTELPDAQTVFVTSPTKSNILMKQMIGRALRGKKAGGTEKCYIVSFIDDWKNKIAWVNPEKLYIEETATWEDNTRENIKKLVRLVSIQKTGSFVKSIDDSIDISELESIEFIKTIPLGIYSFSVILSSEYEDNIVKNCEVLIYDITQKAYKKFVKELPIFFEINKLNDIEYIEENQLEELAHRIENEYFNEYNMAPSYNNEDIKDILRYFALKGVEPTFLYFKDREKFDISVIAKFIYENKLGAKRKKEYLYELWEKKDNFLKEYFRKDKLYFTKCLDNEILKLGKLENEE